MSDLKGRALLLSGRAVFLSRKPGWSYKLEDEIEDALRTVQRETAEIAALVADTANIGNDDGKADCHEAARAIKARFGLEREGDEQAG